MTAVHRVSLSEMAAETGLKALGYAQPHKDRILMRKGLPKSTEKEVLAHEFEHIEKGEEGPFSLGGFVGDLTGGLIGESSAEKAAKNAQRASRESTDKAIGYVDSAWDYLDETLSPYGDIGFENFQAINEMGGPELQEFSFTGEDLKSDPSYQFRLNQGLQAVDRIAAKNRQLTSGNRLASINDYAQGVASTEFGDAWQRAFNTNLANNDIGLKRYATNLGRRQYLSGAGFDADNRLADYKYRTNVDKGNLEVGHAANSTAADMFQAQNKAQAVSDFVSLGSSLGTAAILASDRRLKRDIAEHHHDGKYQWYLFKYVWDDVQRLGVMAQDVLKIKPGAVLTHPSGYLMVDYGAI